MKRTITLKIITMSPFIRAEDIGRKKFQSWLEAIKATDIHFTEEEYCAVDCSFTYKGVRYATEIKVRAEKYMDYPTHMLEQGKLDGMKAYREDNELDVMIYANFFGDYLYIYRLDNNYETESCRLARTSAVNTGKRDKDIIWLEAITALKYYRNEVKWEQL